MLLQLLSLDGLDADLNKRMGFTPICEYFFSIPDGKLEIRSLAWPVLAAEAAETVEL